MLLTHETQNQKRIAIKIKISENVMFLFGYQLLFRIFTLTTATGKYTKKNHNHDISVSPISHGLFLQYEKIHLAVFC